MLVVGHVQAQFPDPVQTYFLALPEPDVKADFQILETSATIGNVMRSVTSITITRDDTYIYFDQWEDGYENTISSPSRTYSSSKPAGTQIWGDNNPANGIPPGFSSDVLSSGDIIALKNDVALPRNSNNVFFDGRDKLASSKAIAVTRAQWAIDPGPVLAGAVELLTINDTGTEYIIPVGENTSSNRMFEHTSVSVMAMLNGTKVDIDKDGNGSIDVTKSINQGETLYVSSGILAGARITATKPVQAHVMTGNKRSNGGALEGRWYTMLPRNRWGKDYYCPVGSIASPNQPTQIFIYNPNASAITVAWQGKSTSGSFSVPASGTTQFQMPLNSAAHLTSDSDFYSVAAVGAGPSNGGASADDNDTWDWGYTPVPTQYLTPQLVVGWGPGADDANNNGQPDGNGSPVYVASTADTTVYVDYDGNASTGPLIDAAGNHYDKTIVLKRLEQGKVFDPGSDRDQTGMKIYTVDGTLLTGAWGEDPVTAGAGNPYLDLGTTIPPYPWPRVIKTSREISDADGTYEPNDVIEYTITIDNLGVVVLTELVVTDALPAGLTYVNGTTTRNGQAYPDDSSGTKYPLDGGGISLPPIGVGEKGTVTFHARINGGVTGIIKNVALINSGPEIYQGTDCIDVQAPTSSPCSIRFTDGSFNSVTTYQENDVIYIELQDQDLNRNPSGVDTFSLTVTNPTNGDEEIVTLTETGSNTGIFRSGPLISSSLSGQTVDDGTLWMQSGQSIQVNYQDPQFAFENCTVPISVYVPSLVKQLYLTGGGPPYNAGLDRVDPVASGDTNTRSSGVLSATGSSSGGIVLDYTASAANPGGTGGVTLSTFATGAGLNRLMLVGVAIDQNAAAEVSGITYGGQSLTRVVAQTNAAGPDRVELWRLVNPPSGNSNVVVSMNGQQHNGMVVVAATFAGVDQGAPLGTPSAASGSSVAVASGASELVFGMVASGSSAPLVGGEGQVQLRQTGDGADIRGAAVTRLGAGTVTLSWSGGASEAVAGVSLKPAQNGESSAVLLWHENGEPQPQFAKFDGTTFGAEGSAPSVGNNKAGMMMSAASPTNPNEAFVLEVTDDSQMHVLRWNGATETFTVDLSGFAVADNKEYLNAGIAYEQSGDALLVYGKKDDNSRIYYRTWNGTTWSGEQNITHPGDKEPRHMSIASSPSSDEIVVAFTESGDRDNYAMVWSGSSWRGITRMDSYENVSGHDYYDIGVAYETLSGRAMVAYGRNDDPGKIYYRLWNGSSWTSEGTLTYPSGSNKKVDGLRLAKDLKSNRIALGVSTDGDDIWFAVWNGSGWQDKITAESDRADRINALEMDVAFETSSGTLMAAWYDKDRDTVRYRTWDSSGGWSSEAAGPDLGDVPRMIRLSSDPLPTSRSVMLVVNDSGSDVSSSLWNGSSWTSPVQHESNTGLNGDGTGVPMTVFWVQGTVADTGSPASSAFFPQIPPMAADLDIPAGGGVAVSAYINLTNGGTPGTATSQVSSNSDDVEEEGPDTNWYYPGAMYLQSSDLEIVRDDQSPSTGAQKVGLRFNGLSIPAGARITTAYLSFTATNPDWPNTNSGAASATIRGQSADNPGTFTYSDFNVSSRSTTSASVSWSNIPAWTTGQTYQSPDLAAVVQEIVDRPGWSGGNSMVFTITGSGSRSAFSYEGSSSSAPRLTVNYVVGGGVPNNPMIFAKLFEDSTELMTLQNPVVTDLGSSIYRLDWSAPVPSDVTIEGGNSVNLSIDNQQSGLEFRVLFDSLSAPSRVDLPTTTVIEVENVKVYDAPFPGGSVVTSASAGDTLYIRSVVSDPFGAYDITSANLVVDQLNGNSGDFVHVVANDEVVFTTESTKTIEYEWYSPDAEGNYQIILLAKEGLENTIQDTGGTQFQLLRSDSGYPSETIFTTAAGIRRAAFDIEEAVCVQVSDFDRRGEGFVVAGITATNGLNEARLLTETSANSGVFAYCYPAGTFLGGEQVTATYVDPVDASDSSTAVAVINDPVIPATVLLSHTQVQPADGIATVGSEVVFQIQVSNPGATRLDDVSVSDVFPSSNLEFISSNISPDSSVPGTLTWPALGQLEQGQSIELTVRFRALTETLSAICSANCGGTVAAGPRTADVEITRPEVSVSKTVLTPVSGELNFGEQAEFRIVVENTGSTVIESLPLTDEYSSALEFVSATIPPDASGGGTAFWGDLTGAGSLAVGASITIDATFAAARREETAPNLAVVSGATDENGDAVPRATSEALVKTNAAAVGDYVWRDQDGDGVQDPHEDGIPGVVIYVDLDGDGTLDSDEPSETTAADGSYLISSLNAGTFTIRVDETSLPAGVAQSFDPDGTLDHSTQTPVLTVTDTYEDADFGYTGGTAAITGQVRLDSDADGDLADADSGVEGVRVELWTDPDADGIPDDGTSISSGYTNASGNYSFGSLAPGPYVVVEVESSGVVSTNDRDGNSRNSFNQIAITLSEGETSTRNDFLDSSVKDFGDMTSFVSASSSATEGLRLGAFVDVEPTAVTNAAATGDDLDGTPDDEDGVTLPVEVSQGQGSSITVNVTNLLSSGAFLNAWIDFNGNGTIGDSGEQIASNVPVAGGTNGADQTINFTVPINAFVGAVGVRVRLTSVSGPGVGGNDGAGEVEDHLLTILAATDDFGDLSSFPSASATKNTNLRLGALVDAENAQADNATATGDDLNNLDDEDGVIVPATINRSETASITANVTNATGTQAYLSAWIDFNGNGVLTDSGEQIATDVVVANGASGANQVINFTVPGGAVLGTVGVRVRLSSSASALSFGHSGFGEVEDYQTSVVCPVISITPTTLPVLKEGTSFSQAFGASTGSAPMTWSLSSGNVPPGLTLSTGGTLSGTPSAGGTSTFGLRVADNFGCLGSNSYTVQVCPIITFSPVTLPTAQIGTPYTQTVVASRGVAPYTFALASGSLPIGLSLNTGTGVISGTPTTAGSTTFSIRATDANGCSDLKSYTLNPACPAVDISTTLLPEAILGDPYSQALTATQGNGGYSWSILSGSLPPGLVMSSAGVISGTPTSQSAATYGFVVRVVDGFGCVATRPLSLRSCPGSLIIAPLALADPTVSSPYSVQLSAGAQGFSIEQAGASGSISNLSQADAVLAGTGRAWLVSTTASTVNYRADASVEGNIPGGRNFPIAGANEFALRATAEILIPTSGVWTFGTNSDDGLRVRIDGANVIVDDTLHAVADRYGQVTLSAGLHTLELVFFEHGGTEAVELFAAQGNYSSFNSNFKLIGGTGGLEARRAGGTYTWSLTAGALPAGLTLNPASGVISGSATSPSAATFTVQAADAQGCAGSRQYTVTPQCAAIAITPSTLPNAEVNVAYGAQSFAATGGSGSYSWNVSTGSLPTGMSLSSGGVVSGTPTAAGLVTFTTRATDTTSCIGTQVVSLRVCPLITFANLSNATVGQAYSGSAAASGGASPYVYQVASGSLPSGMSLNASTGTITGTSNAAATANFVIRATDANGCIKTRSYSLPVVCPTVTLNPTSFPVPTVGSSYSTSVAAAGGKSPYTYAVTSGTLPAGLGLTTGGVLSGTPTSAAAASFQITATDANGCKGTRSYSVTPVCPAVTVAPTSLAFGEQGAPFSATFTATGGTSPRTFAVSAGSLPGGLMLASNGQLSGTPTGNGLVSFTVRATDAYGCIGTRAYNLRVCPVISLGSLASGVVGTPYNGSAAASGGAAPYVYALQSGTLPTGLSFSTTSGAITGTPTVEETTSFTVRATDANGCVKDRAYTLAMDCPSITMSPSVLTKGDIGQPFSNTISASGGTGPYTYSVSSGSLPTGVSLNGASGEISGTPSVAGLFSVTIRATDSYNCVGTKSYDLRICPAIQIAPGTLSDGVVGTPYSTTFVGSDGTSPYVWQLTGTIPSGLTWNASTATLSGTPTAENAGASLTVTATDANGCVGSRVVTLVVSCPVISINPGTLPSGYPTIGFSQSLSATNGTAPFAWSLKSGALPNGLALSAAGVVSGTPTQLETQTFTVRAVDAYGCEAERAITLTIKGLNLGNLVWEDYNNDGLRDPSEQGIEGAMVELYDPGDDDQIGGSGSDADTLVAGPLTTGPSGSYEFTDLFPGNYFVKVTAPVDFTTTSGTPDTSDNDEDNDNNGAQPGGSGTPLLSPVVDLQPGVESTTDGDLDPDTNLTVDFGFWAPMSVGNVVFLDVNGDGDLDPTEGIEGVVVEIYPEGANPLSTSAVGAAFTDNKGRYLITGLNPGRYFLHLPPSQFLGGPLAGTVPMAVVTLGDDNAGQDLVFTSNPTTSGASTDPFDLLIGQAPAGASETGFESDTDDTTDARVDLTRDLGVSAPSGSGFPLAWQDRNTLAQPESGSDAGSPVTSFHAWSFGAEGAAEGDADADGLANLYEYAVGTDSGSGMSGAGALQIDATANGLDAVLTRAVVGRDDVRITLEGRSSLTDGRWSELSGWSAPEFDSEGRQVLRVSGVDQQALFASGRGFVRVKVELDADRNGQAEAVVYSQILGWSRELFGAKTRSFTMPLAKEPIFAGTAVGLNGGSWMAGTEIVSQLKPGRQYFVELRTGPLAGHRIEVDEALSSNETIAFALNEDLTTTKDLGGFSDETQVALREHWSLADLFPVTSLQGGISASSSDRVIRFNRASNTFSTVWLLRKRDGSKIWIADGDVSMADLGQSIVGPGEALLVNFPTSVPVLMTGQVREGTFVHPIRVGTQFVGSGLPVAADFGQSRLGLTPGSSPDTSDRLRIWSSDHADGSAGYWSYYLRSDGGRGTWTPETDGIPQVPVWDSFRGVFYVSPSDEEEWIESLKIEN